MKLTSPLCIFILMLYMSASQAQNVEHPTIHKLEVYYIEDLLSIHALDSGKKVRSHVDICLKQGISVSKINLKVINQADDNIIYEVNYVVNGMNVVDDSGVILCIQDTAGIHITSSNLIPLNWYRYEVTTEDNQTNISPVFSDIH